MKINECQEIHIGLESKDENEMELNRSDKLFRWVTDHFVMHIGSCFNKQINKKRLWSWDVAVRVPDPLGDFKKEMGEGETFRDAYISAMETVKKMMAIKSKICPKCKRELEDGFKLPIDD